MIATRILYAFYLRLYASLVGVGVLLRGVLLLPSSLLRCGVKSSGWAEQSITEGYVAADSKG